MSVCTPSFFGLILLKNSRTHDFIEREKAFMQKRFGDLTEADLNQDEHLIGFSVAMGGEGLRSCIDDLEQSGAVLGEDFVMTSSFEGVLGSLPVWLSLVPALIDYATVNERELKWYGFSNSIS